MNENAQKKIRFAKGLEKAFKNIQSGNKIYIVFSKNSFRLLVFTLAAGITANIILAYLILVTNSNILLASLREISTIIYIAIALVSITAIISGVYLVFKGIDIVTD